MRISPTSANTEVFKFSAARQPNGSSVTGRINSYACVRSGKVTISGAFLQQCESDPAKAKELEESLAFYDQSRQSGMLNAQANAASIGAKLVSYDETWSIDDSGNITMMASTTVTSDTGTRTLKDIIEERLEKKKESDFWQA